MINSFHSGDGIHQPGIVLVDVLDQFGLGIGWACDENGTGVCNRFCDRVQELLILQRVPTADGVCFVMDVPSRIVRMYDEPFDVRRAEMEHTRFMMIDPNDSVIVVLAHGKVPFGRPVTVGAAKTRVQWAKSSLCVRGICAEFDPKPVDFSLLPKKSG
jgi:hypothetical protein